MSGDVQVRFCEHLGVGFPRVTHLLVGFQHRDDAERFQKELSDLCGGRPEASGEGSSLP